MHRVILIAVAAITIGLATPVYAQQAPLNCNSVNITSLDQDAIEKVKTACNAVNTASNTNQQVNTVTPDNVSKWANVAKEFGGAIGSMAKELGVQVNDFLYTPAGILITLYLFWSKLGGVIIGVPLVIAIWALYFKLWDRYRRTPTEFENRPVLFGLFNRQLPTKYDYTDDLDNVMVYATSIGGAMIFITIFIVAVIIF